MKKFRELSEAIKDKYDIGEYDQEGDMAKSDLRSILANAKRVHDMLKDDDNLPEWVQSKITKAEDYMSTVANYLESEMNEETGFEKTFRKNTGETYDQYANRRAKEEDERQEKMKKQKEDYIKQGIIKAESVELDEALRHEIAGQVGRFIGNKIDPVHGDIMHAHGKEAYRQAAYHIRKTVKDVSQAVSDLHDRLHRHLRTGTLTTEEVEELDEISAEVSKRVAQARDRSAVANKLTSTQSKRLKMGDKGGDPDMNAGKALKSAMKRGAKNVYDEEVELDEARYPGFRPGLGLGKRGAPSQRDNYKDFNDGRPFGFTPIKDKKPEEPKKMKEEVEHLEEKNVPTSPEKWARAKAQAKAKFDVYPSAYANGWAAKKYKEMGGGWKSVSEETEELDENMMKKLAAAGIAASLAASPAAQARVTPGGQSVAQQAVATQKAPEQKKASVPSKSYLQTVASGKSRSIMHPDTAKELLKKHYSEETDLDEGYFKNQEIERQETERLAKRNELPFTPDKPKKRSVVVGKKPEGYSRVRQLARQAIPKPVKEAKEMSKKAKIVKDAMKKSPDDTFQAKPELSDSVTRNL